MTTNFTTRMIDALNAERVQARELRDWAERNNDTTVAYSMAVYLERVCTALDAWVARAQRREGGRS